MLRNSQSFAIILSIVSLSALFLLAILAGRAWLGAMPLLDMRL
jgi:polyferredoxin